MSADTHYAVTPATAAFSGLKEEIHATEWPFHLSVAVDETTATANSLFDRLQQLVEAHCVGEPAFYGHAAMSRSISSRKAGS